VLAVPLLDVVEPLGLCGDVDVKIVDDEEELAVGEVDVGSTEVDPETPPDGADVVGDDVPVDPDEEDVLVDPDDEEDVLVEPDDEDDEEDVLDELDDVSDDEEVDVDVVDDALGAGAPSDFSVSAPVPPRKTTGIVDWCETV